MPSGAVQALVKEYKRLTQIILGLEHQRGKIRKALKAYLERRGQDALRVEGLRVLRYETRKTEWDAEKLAGILERAGVPEEIMEQVFPRTVNEDAVMQLVEEGRVDLDKVREAATVRTVWALRVDEVKE